MVTCTRRGSSGSSGGAVDNVRMSPDLLSEHVVHVLDRLSGEDAVRFRGLVARAALDRPVAVEASEAAAVVRPHAWLLDRLGADGVRLTSAGHLPPAVVTEAMDALGGRERWFGAANQEYHTRPVLELRESARRFGLVRKHRGVLVPTKVGRSLDADPVGLWWHVADRLPDARSEADADAGLLLLIVVASGTPFDSAMEPVAAHGDGVVGLAGRRHRCSLGSVAGLRDGPGHLDSSASTRCARGGGPVWTTGDGDGGWDSVGPRRAAART